jgi:Ca-activated chloride channel homolog
VHHLRLLGLLCLVLLLGCSLGRSGGGAMDDDDAYYGDDDDGWDDDDDDGLGDDDDDAWDDGDDGSGEPPLTDDDDTADDDDSAPDEGICDDATDEEVVWYLSADDSNSQADATHTRHLITGRDMYAHGLRTWEFLNYYDFDYSPADEGHVAVVPQLRPVPGDPGAYSLLVGVTSPSMDLAERPPLNITLSVDTSGSMGGPGIGRAKDSMIAMASALQEGDVVSMVRWETSQTIVLDSHVVNGADDAVFLEAIEGLNTGGSTNLSTGLSAAYQLAEANYAPEKTNRVILISDGGANVGTTDEELIAQHADDGEQEAIYMVGVGTPPAQEYNDLLMDTVTDAGKGAYVYVDRALEAERQFGPDGLTRNLAVAARDVRLELTLPAGVMMEVFHGEEASTDPTEVQPQHLAPNDSMLYHQVIRDCSDLDADELEFVFTVTWEDPITREPKVDVAVATLAELEAGAVDQLVKAEAILLYVEALQAVWQIPDWDDRRPYLDDVYGLLVAASLAAPDDPDLSELVDLMDVFRGEF